MPYNGGRVVNPPRGMDPDYDPASTAIGQWATIGGCTGATEQQVSANVTRQVQTGCLDGHGVELYTVIDGGHAWPGGQPRRDLGRRPDHRGRGHRPDLGLLRRPPQAVARRRYGRRRPGPKRCGEHRPQDTNRAMRLICSASSRRLAHSCRQRRVLVAGCGRAMAVEMKMALRVASSSSLVGGSVPSPTVANVCSYSPPVRRSRSQAGIGTSMGSRPPRRRVGRRHLERARCRGDRAAGSGLALGVVAVEESGLSWAKIGRRCSRDRSRRGSSCRRRPASGWRRRPCTRSRSTSRASRPRSGSSGRPRRRGTGGCARSRGFP